MGSSANHTKVGQRYVRGADEQSTGSQAPCEPAAKRDLAVGASSEDVDLDHLPFDLLTDSAVAESSYVPLTEQQTIASSTQPSPRPIPFATTRRQQPIRSPRRSSRLRLPRRLEGYRLN